MNDYDNDSGFNNNLPILVCYILCIFFTVFVKNPSIYYLVCEHCLVMITNINGKKISLSVSLKYIGETFLFRLVINYVLLNLEMYILYFNIFNPID